MRFTRSSSRKVKKYAAWFSNHIRANPPNDHDERQEWEVEEMLAELTDINAKSQHYATECHVTNTSLPSSHFALNPNSNWDSLASYYSSSPVAQSVCHILLLPHVNWQISKWQNARWKMRVARERERAGWYWCRARQRIQFSPMFVSSQDNRIFGFFSLAVFSCVLLLSLDIFLCFVLTS